MTREIEQLLRDQRADAACARRWFLVARCRLLVDRRWRLAVRRADVDGRFALLSHQLQVRILQRRNLSAHVEDARARRDERRNDCWRMFVSVADGEDERASFDRRTAVEAKGDRQEL